MVWADLENLAKTASLVSSVFWNPPSHLNPRHDHIRAAISSRGSQPDMIALHQTGYTLLSLAFPNRVISDQGERVRLEKSIWDSAVGDRDLSNNIIRMVQSGVGHASVSAVLGPFYARSQHKGIIFVRLGSNYVDTQGDAKCTLFKYRVLKRKD